MFVPSTVCVYHFVDRDLRVKIFFEKEEAAKDRGVYFEIEDTDTSAHLYWRLKKISSRVGLFFITFIVKIKKIFKTHLCTFIRY